MQQEKAFILWRQPRAAESYLYRNETGREDKSRSGRIQIRLSGQEGRGAAGRRGTYNGEEPFYLLYSLDVVHFYTDQKFKFDIDKSKKCNQK